MKALTIYNRAKNLIVLFVIKYPIYLFSFIFPRNRNKWIIGSYYGFTDNAKYFYINLLNNNSEVSCYFAVSKKNELALLKEKGIKCFYSYSLIGIWHQLTSKIYIGTHGHGWGVPRVLSGGSKYVELWHGTPIKTIGYLDNYSGFKKINNKSLRIIHKIFYYFSPQYSPRHLFLAPSNFVKDLFKRSFGLADSNFVNSINPRCVSFYWTQSKLFNISNQYDSGIHNALLKDLSKYKKKYIYLPTFRDSDQSFFSKLNFDFEQLDCLRQRNNDVFLIKLHPRSLIEYSETYKDFKNIIILPVDVDLYEILPLVNVLVTDYSSVYIDFMHKKNGYTIFFPFDYDEYISESRELAFDYDTHISGIRVDTFDELLLAIKEERYKDFDPKRKEELFRFFWGNKEDKVDLVSAIKELACK